MARIRHLHAAMMLILAIIAFALVAHAQRSEMIPYPDVLNATIDDSTVVRFYFFPPTPSDRPPHPLVLRVADPTDERTKVAPVLSEGRTIHVSVSEMQKLVAEMRRLIKIGQSTRGVEVLGDWQMIPITDAMDVVVIFSSGAARGFIPRNEICKTLAPLNSVIQTPRAHWEFERFRVSYGCRVPRFNPAKYNEGQ